MVSGLASKRMSKSIQKFVDNIISRKTFKFKNCSEKQYFNIRNVNNSNKIIESKVKLK